MDRLLRHNSRGAANDEMVVVPAVSKRCKDEDSHKGQEEGFFA